MPTDRRSGSGRLALLVASLDDTPKKKAARDAPLPPLNQMVVDFATIRSSTQAGQSASRDLHHLAVDALREPPMPGEGRSRDPEGRSPVGRARRPAGTFCPETFSSSATLSSKARRSLSRSSRRTPPGTPGDTRPTTAIVAQGRAGASSSPSSTRTSQTKGKDRVRKRTSRKGLLRMDSLQKGGWIKAYRPARAASRIPRPGRQEGP